MTASTVTTIDCHYVEPEFAAAYLIEDAGEAAFIDNNTTHAVPRLLGALAARGLKPEQVRYLVITHVHLDHAGGTAELLRHCAQATVLAHPRAAPHVIDPSRLVASSRQVYGDVIFERLYGTLSPIDASRVRTLDDEATVVLGARKLRFLHTRGHANHHFCILDEETGSIFTGDSFGLRYPRLQGSGLFIVPSTSPTDFDAQQAMQSVERIAATGARTAYPTHFGGMSGIDSAAQELKYQLAYCGDLVERAVASSLPDGELQAFCLDELKSFYESYTTDRKLAWGPREQECLRLDLEINAQGLAYVIQKRRNKKTGS